MKRKQSKKRSLKPTIARVKKAPVQLSKQLPAELLRLKEVLSEKAVDFVLPLTRLAQTKLHTLEAKLSGKAV